METGTTDALSDDPGLTIGTVLRIFLPFAFAYVLSYLFRVVNAVIAPDLTSEMGLDPADLGLMTSAYFLCFAAFQLPLGILLDRYGPRRTESCLLIVAAVGAVVFATAESIVGLAIGRGLIGLGVSACLMAAVTAFARWFQPERLAFANGMQAAAGGLGAVLGTVPVEASLGWVGWRGLFFILAALTLSAAVALFTVVPRRNEVGAGGTLAEQLAGTRSVFSNRIFLVLLPATVFCQAGFLSVQTLWTGPWFRDVAGLDRSATAGMLLAVALALVAGMVSFGAMSQFLSRRGLSPERFMVLGMGSMVLCLAAVSWAPVEIASVLLVVLGFLGGSIYLPFSVLVSKFPRGLAGRVSTALNVVVFSFAFALQWAIGVVIDLWPQRDDGGYAVEGYTTSLTALVVLQVLGFLVLLANWRHVEGGSNPDLAALRR